MRRRVRGIIEWVMAILWVQKIDGTSGESSRALSTERKASGVG